MAKEVIFVPIQMNPASLEQAHPGLKIASVSVGRISDEEDSPEGIKITFVEEPSKADSDAFEAMMSAKGYAKQQIK